METGLRPVLPDHRKGHGEAQDTGRGASPDSETRPKRDLGQARQAPGCEGRDVAGGGRAPGPPSRLTPDALRGAAFQQPLAADPTSRPRNVACAPESSLHAPLSVSDSPRVLQGSRWGSRLVTVLSRARAEQAWQTWGSSEPGPALRTRTPLPSQPAQSHGPGTSFGYCRRPPRWPGEAPARTRAGEQQRWGPPPPFTATGDGHREQPRGSIHTHRGGFQETSLLVLEGGRAVHSAAHAPRVCGRRRTGGPRRRLPAGTASAELHGEFRSREERTRGGHRADRTEEMALASEALRRLRARVLETPPRMGLRTREGRGPARGQSCWGHIGDERPIGLVSLLRVRPRDVQSG